MSGPDDELAIGVTGHRLQRLAGADLVLLEHRFTRLFAAIQTCAEANGKAEITLLSNFADGADRIAGWAALNLGWTLDAVLPFPRADFARDFKTERELAAFIAQLDRSRSEQAMQPARAAGDDGTAGYESAGRTILDRCNLLVAVWDKAPAQGRGGAAQIIAEAVDRAIPVAVIDPCGSMMIETLGSHGAGAAAILRQAVATLTSI